jgi:acetolactate synthase small subunit
MEIRDLSQMTIVLKGQDGAVEQARIQLEDLVSLLSAWPPQEYG